MVTSAQALKKYGDPKLQKSMVIFDVPTALEVGVIPKKLYCNKDMVAPLTKAFQNLITTGAIKSVKTWDGCFNIRTIKGKTTMSLHSWGLAIDINASTNAQGKPATLPMTVVKCFKDAGFDWGGDWPIEIRDGMHFQLSVI